MVQLALLAAVPESPRWLLATGRVRRAERVIKYIAAKNGNTDFARDFRIDAPDVEDSSGAEDEGAKPGTSYGIRDLFDRRILMFTLVQFVTWPAVSLGYFGGT